MSAPATKALFPEPVKIIALTELSSCTLFIATLSSKIVLAFNAFNCFGLLIVIWHMLLLFRTTIFLNSIYMFFTNIKEFIVFKIKTLFEKRGFYKNIIIILIIHLRLQLHQQFLKSHP